jgi:hypothetical protein
VLVEPGLVGSASTASAGSDRVHGCLGPARPLTLDPGLLLGPPAHLPFQAPLGRATGGDGSLLGPELAGSLLQLLCDLRPLEVAPERRVLDVVVGSELPQRLAGRSAPNQRLVGNEPTQSPPPLHTTDSIPRLTHQKRTNDEGVKAHPRRASRERRAVRELSGDENRPGLATGALPRTA